MMSHYLITYTRLLHTVTHLWFTDTYFLWTRHGNGEQRVDTKRTILRGGGLGSSTIFKNLMSTTPRRKWYLTTGRRAHSMVLDPIPPPLPVHFFGSRPQPPTSHHLTMLSCFCILRTPDYYSGTPVAHRHIVPVERTWWRRTAGQMWQSATLRYYHTTILLILNYYIPYGKPVVQRHMVAEERRR